MYRTLAELRDSVNSMIDAQGENAACAAFVFTQHDVFEFNEETNQDDYFPTLFTQDVLADVGGSSYIYEQVGEMIDDAIRYRKKLPIYADWWLLYSNSTNFVFLTDDFTHRYSYSWCSCNLCSFFDC